MSPFADIDFNNRLSALQAVGVALGAPAAAIPASTAANSQRTYLHFINAMRVSQSLPPLPDLDYSGFVPALNVLVALVPVTSP